MNALISGPTLVPWRSMGLEEDRFFIAMVVIAGLAMAVLAGVVVFSI